MKMINNEGLDKKYTKKLFKKKRWKDFEKPATMKSGAKGSKMINLKKLVRLENRFSLLRGWKNTDFFFLCNFRITTEIKTVWKKLN